MRWSIRCRLTLWNTLALAVVLLGFSALVYVLMARGLYQQVDLTLLAEHQQLKQDERLMSDPAGRLRYWIDEFQEHEKNFCIVYDGQGQVYARTVELADASVPPLLPPGPGETHFDSATLPIIGHQRLLSARLRLRGEEFTVVHLAPLENVDRELGHLLKGLAMAVPVALLLSGGLAYLLARKALAPVEQLHRATERITADRLDRRLPLANSDDELGRLTQTINAMIARLERSFAEIRRFTADASHELRTPLTAIRTEAEVALRKPLTLADHQQLLSSVLEEVERLTRLTDQLLALSREDVGTTGQACEPVDLAALLTAVVETMRPLADVKGLGLCAVCSDRMWVRGDAARLRQVFYNLLDNAIKYTPAGGRVEVRLRREGPSAVATVRDTGIGIPPEHLPHVFERFYRADKARSREQGGTGLGLSIVQCMVAAHGGRVGLTSTPGQGTTCTVTLPVEPKS
ncbi:MAG: ATP-binding protein [Gemmataceae bacterium]|nr:ATP-binding protein [Gemmataceae bacterium]